MRGRGISFHGPVNSAEAGGHRSKPEVVLASAINDRDSLRIATTFHIFNFYYVSIILVFAVAMELQKNLKS